MGICHFCIAVSLCLLRVWRMDAGVMRHIPKTKCKIRDNNPSCPSGQIYQCLSDGMKIRKLTGFGPEHMVMGR